MTTLSELRAKRAAYFPHQPSGEVAVRAVHEAPAKPPTGQQSMPGTSSSTLGIGTAVGGSLLLQETDYNPELRGKALYDQIDRMRKSDSQIKAVLSMLKLPIRAAEWKFEAASDQQKDQDIKEWIEDRFMNRQFWNLDYILRHALLSLDFGHMLMETVFEIVDDDIENRPMAHLKQLAPIMPRTIRQIYVSKTGDLDFIMQQSWTGEVVDQKIDGDRLLPFVHEMEGSDYRGVSILRQARKDWVIKERLQRINQVAIEKRSSGVDLGKMDENAIADPKNKTAFENVLQGVRVHERGFMLLPPGHDYEIRGIQGAVLDPLPSIKYHDMMILRGILADYLNAGTGETGSFAMVRDRSSFFLMALLGVAKEITEPINRWLIPRWVQWNWPDVEDFPKLVHSRLDKRDVGAVSSALKELIPLGVITPDDGMEHDLRDMLDLTDLEDTHMPGQPPTLPPALLPPGGPPPALPPGPTPPAPGNKDPNTDPQIAAYKKLRARIHAKSDVLPIHVRTDRPIVNELRKYKPRTKAERAVDWSTLSSALDLAEIKIVSAYRSIQNRQIEKIVDEAMKAVVDLDTIKLEAVNVPFKGEAAELLLKPLTELYRLGQNEVRAEMGRMDGDVIRLSAPIDVDADETTLAFLRSRARMISTVLSDRLRGSLVRKGMDMIRTKETDRGLLRSALTDLSERSIKTEASASVVEALNLGRKSMAARNEALVKVAEFSAIMDDTTCPACSRVDGKEFVYDSSEFKKVEPPYEECLGRSRCRCVFIYTFAQTGDITPRPKLIPPVAKVGPEIPQNPRMFAESPADPLQQKTGHERRMVMRRWMEKENGTYSVGQIHQTAVSEYQDFAYRPINQYLRFDETPDPDYTTLDEVKSSIASLNGAIKGSKGLSEPVVAWRGMSLKKSSMDKLVPGSKFVDKGFSSMSLDKEVANKFMVSGEKDEVAAVVKVLVPKGTKMINPDILTRNENEMTTEMEMLPRSGRTFHVIDRTESNGKTEITVVLEDQ